jgi:endonuclease YncB( thermonuclease family)
MRKTVLTLLLVFSLLFPMVPKDSYAATYTSTVDRVVDGDTIYLTQPVLGKTKVRLLSIDAPESYYNGQSQDPWGTDAKNYLTQLLPPGTPVTIETDVEDTDAYGRLLAHVWKGSLDVNKEMLRQGYAVTYYIWPNMKYFEDYQAAYLEAKQNGRGIWNPSNPLQELPFEFRDRVSGSSQDKYVGDYYTKKYVDPVDYKQIPIENRVFFFTESDAINAGYTKSNSGTASPLYINEVLPAPQSKFTQEFVEIYNPNNEPVDIGGYVIDDIVGGGSAPYTIPSGTVIPAKGYYIWETNNYFNNSGDTVTLKAKDGTILDQYSYSSTAYDASWYRYPDGGNWSSTQDLTPTKGSSNN